MSINTHNYRVAMEHNTKIHKTMIFFSATKIDQIWFEEQLFLVMFLAQFRSFHSFMDYPKRLPYFDLFIQIHLLYIIDF